MRLGLDGGWDLFGMWVRGYATIASLHVCTLVLLHFFDASFFAREVVKDTVHPTSYSHPAAYVCLALLEHQAR